MDYTKDRKLQYVVFFAVSLSSMTCGVCMYWTTPMLTKFHDNNTGIYITESEESWLTSLASPGIMTGSLLSSLMADRFGRRPTLLGSVVPMLVATILVVLATKAWMLYITRFLWGSGIGILVTISAIYLAEIADKDIRGTLTVGNRFMFNFGSFAIMTIGPFVSYSALNYMILSLPTLYFAVCWWIPETPYYLLKEGKVETARKELSRLKGLTDYEAIDEQLTKMQTDVKKEMRRSGTVKELVTGKQYRRAILIAIGLKVTQILSGSMPILQYLGRIMQDSKTDLEVSTALIIFGAVRFIAGILASYLVEKVGRRPLLICSYAGSCIFLAMVGAYFYYKENIGIDNESTNPVRFIPLSGIILSNILSTIGFDSLVFVIPAEIFPINVKSIAMTSLTIIGGVASFFIVKCYHEIKYVAGFYGVFWFYSCAALIGAVFSYFIVPETKGKSLSEIQIKIQGKYYDCDDETCIGLNKVNNLENNVLSQNSELKNLNSNSEKDLKDNTVLK